MRKAVLSLVAIALLVLSASTQAGALKNLIIETDDAIYAEFYENAERSVVSITEHELVTTTSGVDVKTKVVSKTSYNKLQTWSCVVSFEKTNNKFIPVAVECGL